MRAEAFQEDLPILRRKVSVPIAAGEEWGNRWDFNKLVENHDIDLCARDPAECRRHHRDDEDRRHLRNALRGHRAAFHRTHFYGGAGQLPGHLFRTRLDGVQLSGPHAAASARVPEFKNGKLYPNDRPGLGVELDMKQLQQIAEITQPVTDRAQTYFRPDGSITNW